MKHETFAAAIAVFLIGVVLGCGCTGTSNNQQAAPGPQQLSDGELLASIPPPFPGDFAPQQHSAVHTTSEADSLIPGDMEIAEDGDNNYEDPGIDAFVIVPGFEDDLAFAQYSLGGLGDDRPININLDVASAPLIPGGDDPLPLSFWVGLSNYTEFAWEWFGPFDGSQSLVMNSPAVLDRYIGHAGTLYFCMVTIPGDEFVTPENPDGLTSCQVNLSTVTTESAASGDYNATKPLFVPIESHSPSSLPPPKDGSALDPSQYVTLNWTHTPDAQNPASGPTTYQVFRQGPADAQPLLIGSVDAPISNFVDPTDTDGTVAEATPGLTYSYYLRAANGQGHTSFDGFTVTIPTINWTHTWGSANFDTGNAIAYDVDGEIYVTGSSDDDFMLMYYEADGTLINVHTLGGVLEEFGQGICVDAIGDKYVVGHQIDGIGLSFIVILKFLADNTKAWDKSWQESGSIAYGVACDTVNDFIYVTGRSSDVINNTVLLKLDADGNIVTTPQPWDGSWTDIVNSKPSFGQAIALGAGAVFVAGHYSSDSNRQEAMVMKVDDESRNLDWAKSWGTADGDGALALAVNPDSGEVFFTGYHMDDQVMVVKLNPIDGSVVWQKAWTVSNKTGRGNAIVLSGGSVIVAGDLEGDAFVLKVSAATGDLESQEIWGTVGTSEVINGLALAPDLNSLLATGSAVNAAGTASDPGGDWTDIDIIDSTLTSLGLTFIGGFSTMNEIGYNVVTPVGTEDTGGGDADVLVTRSSL